MIHWPLLIKCLAAVPVSVLLIVHFFTSRDLRKDLNTMYRSNPPITDPELVDLCEKLWELDKNRLQPGVDYKLDLQGRTRYSYDGPDRAKDPLFEFVDSDALNRDTYKAFIALLDNYERETGVPETVTEEEKRENWRFTDLVLKSDCMKEAYKFLKSKKAGQL